MFKRDKRQAVNEADIIATLTLLDQKYDIRWISGFLLVQMASEFTNHKMLSFSNAFKLIHNMKDKSLIKEMFLLGNFFYAIA